MGESGGIMHKVEHRVVTHVTSYCCNAFLLTTGNGDHVCSYCGGKVTYLGGPEYTDKNEKFGPDYEEE